MSEQYSRTMALFRGVWADSEQALCAMSEFLTTLDSVPDYELMHGEKEKLDKYAAKVKRAMNATSLPKWLDKLIDAKMDECREKIDELEKQRSEWIKTLRPWEIEEL